MTHTTSPNIITDFCTGRKIDIAAIDRMIQYAEQSKEFTMGTYFNQCGTAGCLCGTYILREGGKLANHVEDEFVINGVKCDDPFTFICRVLNLSWLEGRFLFVAHEREMLSAHLAVHTCLYINGFRSNVPMSSENAWDTQKQEAIARLRKFRAYKIRKSQLLEDYEASRRTEGNQNYLKQVLDSVPQSQIVSV